MSDGKPTISTRPLPSLMAELAGAEQQFLSGNRDRGADLESAVQIFLEFLRDSSSLLTLTVPA